MKRERRADADRAIHRHLAAGLLHKSVNLRQAQSSAATDLLGREKRFENLVDLVRGNAAARIANRDGDEFSRRRSVRARNRVRRPCEPDRQRSLAVHGISRIGGKIDHDGFKLVGVGLDCQGTFSNIQVE